MIDPLESIDIRVGNRDDENAITEFALAISEDPITMREKWAEETKNGTIYPLIAVFRHNIVGRVQAKIQDGFGWLETVKIAPDFRRKGLAHTLVNAAMDWLIASGVSKIRTVVDSDNLTGRLILERHHFNPKFLAINPTYRIVEEEINPLDTSTFATLLDDEFYNQIHGMLKDKFASNIYFNGRYITFDNKLFQSLIMQKKIYVNYELSCVLILSTKDLSSEFHGFIIANKKNDYRLGGLALKAFANRELATTVICHAPAARKAVVGLAQADFGWSQPYSIIIYERDSWQERE